MMKPKEDDGCRISIDEALELLKKSVNKLNNGLRD
jgi:hypothetical protein